MLHDYMNTNKTPVAVWAVIIVRRSDKMLYSAPWITYLNNVMCTPTVYVFNTEGLPLVVKANSKLWF